MMGYKLFSTGKNQHKSVHFFTEKNRENATVLSCLPIDNFNLTRKTNKQILNKFYCGIKKSPNSKNHKFSRQIVMFVLIWASKHCIFTKKCQILKIWEKVWQTTIANLHFTVNFKNVTFVYNLSGEAEVNLPSLRWWWSESVRSSWKQLAKKSLYAYGVLMMILTRNWTKKLLD